MYASEAASRPDCDDDRLRVVICWLEEEFLLSEEYSDIDSGVHKQQLKHQEIQLSNQPVPQIMDTKINKTIIKISNVPPSMFQDSKKYFKMMTRQIAALN